MQNRKMPDGFTFRVLLHDDGIGHLELAKA
jgi:hypothetical protein